MIEMTSNQPYLLRAIHQWILDNDLTPHLLVNATLSSVQVPRQSVQNGQIVLNIAPHAVQALEIDNEAVRFMARFSGVSHSIYLPIHSVLAIYASENGQGMVFPELDNSELVEESKTDDNSEDVKSVEGSQKTSSKKPPVLKIIK